jgi:predicted transcriptional regulator
MPRSRLSRPTDAELAILWVLWDRGPSTVRQVHDVIASGRPLAYTTTLKLLQIMLEKGLVARTGEDRTHVYVASLGREEAQRQLVGELLDRAFGGSAAALVMQALATGRASDEDLKAIRRLLDEHEGEDAHDQRD